ncbi:Zn-dependent protease (includes SpoIVFB) [Andreprevotia lacus DSM 23236]|jgi:Zn-dependent protease|uniref:Zn-dependent protease (Includes SpoIVFB) n=1 Tax=Andreprevotia lacus DSM 23236 TaxID=1121001 RepID=A0A1W1X2W8_9NEIS|nr:site-2 protease family protein [Andreprevotia lacus]SMC18319.1 Zn-dependent protease (includes SpoIVFB) [Andreprevotia lacus DSM 23236]
MPRLLDLLPLFFVLLLVSPLMRFVLLVYQFLLVEEYPAHITPGEDRTLPAHEQAAVDELLALGFAPVRPLHIHIGPMLRHGVLLRHRDEAAWALLTFAPSLGTGYPVLFFSVTDEDTLLLTCNRMSQYGLVRLPATLSGDAWADDLPSHWQDHLTRARQHGLQTLDEAQAHARICQFQQSTFPALQASGNVVQRGGGWFYPWRTALRLTRQVMRKYALMQRPYQSASTEGSAAAAAYYAFCAAEHTRYLQLRRKRPWLQELLLLGTALLGLLGWGWLISWQQAVLLLIILLVHESGHAIAMRLFGYRDVKMFVVPFVGAVVTGRPSAIPAWKQAIAYLAGPLPGLLAGFGMLFWLGSQPPADWHQHAQLAAIMAVVINLFNLLPVIPLDGGRLLELALFQRWPTARLLFTLLSIAATAWLASQLSSPGLWIIPAVLVLGLRHQWQTLKLHHVPDPGGSEQERLAPLFERAMALKPGKSYLALSPLVRGIFVSRAVQAPRWWESVAILLTLAAPLAFAGWLAMDLGWIGHKAPAMTEPTDQRSNAQTAFDVVFNNDIDDEAAAKVRQSKLLDIASRLPASDPRHVDLAWDQALRLDDSDKAQDAIIAAGKDGNLLNIDQMIDSQLNKLLWTLADRTAAERASALAGAIAHYRQLAPAHGNALISATIRQAEATDDAGHAQEALAILNSLAVTGNMNDSTQNLQQQITAARGWYLLSHQQYKAALGIFTAPHPQSSETEFNWPRQQQQLNHAWALLLGGDKAGGLAAMRDAAVFHKPDTRWSARLLGMGNTPAVLMVEPGELVYALLVNGKRDEAAKLFGNSRSMCSNHDHDEPVAATEPWQRVRVEAMRNALASLCAGSVRFE